MSSPARIVLAHPPAADVEVGPRVSPWRRLLPLWRYAMWLVLLFSISAVSVAVRLDARQAQRDLHRNGQITREAQLTNERLHLEVQTRTRAIRMEAQAAQLGLVADAERVRVEHP